MRGFQGALNYCAAALFFASAASCGSWFLPPLEVVSVAVEPDIRLAFSARPSVSSVRKAFTLTEDGVTVSGDFSFDGKNVGFKPVNGIRQNRAYQITVTTVAEDEKGNSLLQDFFYGFYTKPDTEAPLVRAVFPPDGSVLENAPSEIAFTFSKPVSENSFVNALKITPSLNHVLVWNGARSAVSVTPLTGLSYGRYTVSISTALSDEYGNTLLLPFSATFLYGTDLSAPACTLGWADKTSSTGAIGALTATHNIPSDSEIIITFDEKVAIETIAGFLEITPTVAFSLTPDIQSGDRAVISFTGKPAWNTPYELVIRKGIADIAGNKTKDDARYTIVFDNPAFKPVYFAGAFLKNGGAYNPINSSTDFSALVLNAADFPQTSARDTDLYAAFSLSPQAAAISIVSAMRHISISTTNGCAAVSLRTINILTDAEVPDEIAGFIIPEDADDTICVLKAGLEITNEINNGFVLFTFGESISDNLGNTMNESRVFTYNKQ
jgi:hypothetical protein